MATCPPSANPAPVAGSTGADISTGRFFEVVQAQDRFCEGRFGSQWMLFGGRMEPFNSGSAVFILGFALYGLFMPKKTMGSSIQILFSLMFVNGVTSVIVHGSGIRGFGYIDSMSIVVMLMMGCSAIVDEIATEDKYMCPCVGNKRGRRFISTFGYFLSSTFALFALGFNAADAVPLVNLWVALTTAVTVILCIVIASIVWNYNKRVESTYHQVKQHGTKEHKERKLLPLRYRHTTMNLMLRTVIPMILGLICWAVDTFSCSPRFPLLHGFWHILLSYSMLCLISFASYIRVDNESREKKPTIRWRNPFCCGFFCCKKGYFGNKKDYGPWKGHNSENTIPWYWAVAALPTVDWKREFKLPRHEKDKIAKAISDAKKKAVENALQSVRMKSAVHDVLEETRYMVEDRI